jgi:hypothetical protein
MNNKESAGDFDRLPRPFFTCLLAPKRNRCGLSSTRCCCVYRHVSRVLADRLSSLRRRVGGAWREEFRTWKWKVQEAAARLSIGRLHIPLSLENPGSSGEPGTDDRIS